MIKIKIIVVGKIKENYFNLGIEEYKKRLKAFCDIDLIEVKEINTNDNVKNLKEEKDEILSNIDNDDYVVTLEIKGKEIDSVELANLIKDHYIYSSKIMTFIIGSSCGLDNEVIKRADYHLSFGKMTFPHQMMRMILFEQLYRAMTIINNHKYHK
ncbi:MAG: 23S rRNA (pseudouridine(1915)-N(3))-methyltransferase RlmH [Bacilli bacterium]|nr:23S rRNA (pseudouridine(1915)-N(3))-methyltransferase RlmH [Bacilli bacterium]